MLHYTGMGLVGDQRLDRVQNKISRNRIPTASQCFYSRICDLMNTCLRVGSG